MFTILQMALAVFQNFIPAGGVVFRGWSPATALTLYWCENLVGSILVALRIAVHRRLTSKRGHYRHQINANSPADERARTTYLAEFLQTSLAFTLVHGVFLAALLAAVVKQGPDREQVLQGLTWMVAAQITGFLLDLARLRTWSFAELKQGANRLIGRIVLIQFSILGGMLFAAFSSRPHAFFAVFGALKTLSDVAGRIPYNPKPSMEAPRWFLRFTSFIGQGKHWKTGQDTATWWRETTLAERKQVEKDEEVLAPGRRSY